MRAVVLLALLYSTVVLGGDASPVAEQKKALAEQAREAARGVDEYAAYVALLQPMPPENLRADEIEPYILLDKGWSAITENGVWSLGKRSSMYIRLDEGSRPRQLQIQGAYFNGEEPTRLLVNGQLLSEKPLLNLTVDLPAGLEDSPALRIELQHLNPMSPRDLKPSNPDTRKIKFKLEQIRIW